MPDPPTVHMVCGQICSGKTTFARRLERETGAVRFSPDEWMLRLYDHTPSYDRFDEYFYRCCDVAWGVCEQLLARGLDVILDFSLWSRADRRAYAARARALGARPVLYHTVCRENVIRARLHARNADLPADTFRVSDEMFDHFAPGFEPPTPDEHAVEIRTDDGEVSPR